MNPSSLLQARQIYRWPIIIAFTTLAGLLFALLGDGLWDAVSWALLILPIVIIISSLIRRKRDRAYGKSRF